MTKQACWTWYSNFLLPVSGLWNSFIWRRPWPYVFCLPSHFQDMDIRISYGLWICCPCWSRLTPVYTATSCGHIQAELNDLSVPEPQYNFLSWPLIRWTFCEILSWMVLRSKWVCKFPCWDPQHPKQPTDRSIMTHAVVVSSLRHCQNPNPYAVEILSSRCVREIQCDLWFVMASMYEKQFVSYIYI